MRWPVAVSFSQPDLKLAEAVSRRVERQNVGVYCYTDKITDQVGERLYLLHQKIFADAHFIAFFLRSDFLDRPYTELEYRLGMRRADALRRSVFFPANDDCEFLVPRDAPHVLRLHCRNESEINLEEECAAMILAAIRSV